MENVRNNYTSFELMKIFNIKRGSWQYIKNKYNLELYRASYYDKNKKQNKFLYTQEAYNILKQSYQIKCVEEGKNNPKVLALLEENSVLRTTLEDYKNINSKFETMYLNEREKSDNLLAEKVKLQQEVERLKNRSFFDRLLNK